jgi:predicted permease
MHPILRAFLILTAAPDALIGLAMIVATDWLARLLHLPPPAHPLFVQIAGLMISFLSIAYLIAAANPSRHRAYVFLAASARYGTAAFLAYAASRGEVLKPFTALVAAELITGSVYLLYAIRLREDRADA